jgi:hypothetical protein
MEMLAVEWNGPPKNGTKLSADVHAGLLLTTASLIAPGVAQFAIATVRTAVPNPTLLTTDHPLPVNPVVSMRPDGRWIVTLQLGVPRVTVPPGHSSTGTRSLFVKLVIDVVSVVGEHVGGGVTLLQIMSPFALKPVTNAPLGHV